VTRAVFNLEKPASNGGPGTAIVSGEVDATNADDFAQSVLALPGPRPVILELSRLGYLDSAGFAALDRLLAEDAVVIVIAPESRVHKAAALMALPFHHDTDAARRSIDPRN
jgi:anti-anti-sigma regulatory factor